MAGGREALPLSLWPGRPFERRADQGASVTGPSRERASEGSGQPGCDAGGGSVEGNKGSLGEYAAQRRRWLLQ